MVDRRWSMVDGLVVKPIDSIRWEVFAESLRDYAILQTAGIKPDDPMLAEVKSYAGFRRISSRF